MRKVSSRRWRKWKEKRNNQEEEETKLPQGD